MAVGLRFQIAETEVFQFPFELPDTEPVRQRREDVHRLLGDVALFIRR